ncbi:MAG TPA: hypothetical protein DCE44_00160 [Verrucomicrobiales bacterium]|nr:hypothetical protein [Verrucomicrobiales bacterium]
MTRASLATCHLWLLTGGLAARLFGLPDAWGASLTDRAAGLQLVRQWTALDGLPDNRVKAILRSSDGRLWLGTRAGLVRMDANQLDVFTPTNTPELPSLDVQILVEDAAGAVWAGTPRGVVRWQNDRWDRFDEESGLPHGLLFCILPDTRSGLWVGTFGGLAQYHDGHWRSFTDGSGLNDVHVTALTEGPDGQIWIGTYRSLQRLDPVAATFTEVAMPPGVENQMVHAIHFGALGDPWILVSVRERGTTDLWHRSAGEWRRVETSHAVVGDQMLLPASSQTGTFWKLSAGWGLEAWTAGGSNHLMTQPPIPTEWVWSLTEDPDGNLWVGGDGTGLQLWRRSEDAANPVPFEKARTMEAMRAERRQHLRLAGGAGLALAATALALGWHSRRSRRRVRLAREEATATERSRLARDLHDSVGSGLTRITLLADQARHSQNGSASESQWSSNLSQSARDLAEVFQDALWAVNPVGATLDGLLAHLAEDTQTLVNAAGLRCRVLLPGEVPDLALPAPVCRQIFLAVKEALHNAIKHASASEIRLVAMVQSNLLDIRIEDNGLGMGKGSSRTESAGRGLTNMRARLEALDGEMRIVARVGGGTCVEFRLPLLPAHAT